MTAGVQAAGLALETGRLVQDTGIGLLLLVLWGAPLRATGYFSRGEWAAMLGAVRGLVFGTLRLSRPGPP